MRLFHYHIYKDTLKLLWLDTGDGKYFNTMEVDLGIAYLMKMLLKWIHAPVKYYAGSVQCMNYADDVENVNGHENKSSLTFHIYKVIMRHTMVDLLSCDVEFWR